MGKQTSKRTELQQRRWVRSKMFAVQKRKHNLRKQKKNSSKSCDSATGCNDKLKEEAMVSIEGMISIGGTTPGSGGIAVDAQLTRGGNRTGHGNEIEGYTPYE